MTFQELQRKDPEAADGFVRLLRDEQDGSVPYDLEAWDFSFDGDGILRAIAVGESFSWSPPDWLDDNDVD